MKGILRTLLILWVAIPVVMRAESADTKLDAYVADRLTRFQELAEISKIDDDRRAAAEEEMEGIIRDLLLPPPEIVELLQDELEPDETRSSLKMQVIEDASEAFQDDPGIIMLAAQLERLISDPSKDRNTVLEECLEMTRYQVAYYLESEFAEDPPEVALEDSVPIATALIESRGILDVHAAVFRQAESGELAASDAYLVGFAASRSGFLDLAAYYLLVALRDTTGPHEPILDELRFVFRRMTGWKVQGFDLPFFVWRCERHLAKGEYEFVLHLIDNEEILSSSSEETPGGIVSLKLRCLYGLKRFEDVVEYAADSKSAFGGDIPEFVVRLEERAQKNIELERNRSRALAKAEAGEHAEAAKLFEGLWGDGKAEIRDAILAVKHHVLAGNLAEGKELARSALAHARGEDGGKLAVYVPLLESVVEQTAALSAAKTSLDKAIVVKKTSSASSKTSSTPSRPSKPAASSLADEFLRLTK